MFSKLQKQYPDALKITLTTDKEATEDWARRLLYGKEGVAKLLYHKVHPNKTAYKATFIFSIAALETTVA